MPRRADRGHSSGFEACRGSDARKALATGGRRRRSRSWSEAFHAVRELRASVASMPVSTDARYEIDHRLKIKEAQFAEALRLAAAWRSTRSHATASSCRAERTGRSGDREPQHHGSSDDLAPFGRLETTRAVQRRCAAARPREAFGMLDHGANPVKREADRGALQGTRLTPRDSSSIPMFRRISLSADAVYREFCTQHGRFDVTVTVPCSTDPKETSSAAKARRDPRRPRFHRRRRPRCGSAAGCRQAGHNSTVQPNEKCA